MAGSLVVPVLLVTAYLAVVYSQTGPGLPCICLEELNQSLPVRTLTSIVNAGDGSGRLFATELIGVVLIYDTNGTRFPEPFIDLTDTASMVNVKDLLSITFHPDYASNGRVYLYLTIVNSTTGAPDAFFSSVIYEFRVSGSDPNKLDPTTARFVFEIHCPTETDCHNGGTFIFGPDNYLYVGHGDAGCCGDIPNNGQNRTNYLGAIHRIDVDTRTGGLEYGIPPDNPFLSDPTTPPEMYAYGFRQPYYASMDKGDPITGEGYGRIFIGEVGADTWEEINILESGGNYGWSAYEGPNCFKPELCDNIGPHVESVASYNHSHYGICVISGSMYRGSRMPGMNGWYFFSDYVAKMFAMYEATPGVWDWYEQPLCDVCPGGLINRYPYYITCMGTSETGEQYFAGGDSTYPTFAEYGVYRIADPNEA